MTRDEELSRLMAEQRADDTSRQRPERHGGDHGEPVLSLEALTLDASATVDGTSVSGVGLGGDYDEAKGPGLTGRYVQAHVAPLWAHVEDPNGEQAAIVRKAVEGMTDDQRETFRLIFAERLSYRQAADVLGIDVSSVRDRVETLKRIVLRALAQAAGGAS